MIETIYHDLDGVHADIAKKTFELSGIPFSKITSAQFWEAANTCPEFFWELERLETSQALLDATSHVRCVVLTALPLRFNGEDQKRKWVKKHLGYLEVIVVPAKNKADYATPNSILIDDTLRNINWWVSAGGIGIHHTSLENTIELLKQHGAHRCLTL